MKKSAYTVKFVLNVLERLGFKSWKATKEVTLLNHEVLLAEVVLDIDHSTLPAFVIEKKLRMQGYKKNFLIHYMIVKLEIILKIQQIKLFL